MRNRIDLCREWVLEKKSSGVRFVFPAPKGAGVRPFGFDRVNDAAADVMGWDGFRLRLITQNPDTQITVTAGFADEKRNCRYPSFALAQAGMHLCDLALQDFEIERAKSNIWRELTFLEIMGDVCVAEAELLRGRRLAVETGILGKAGNAGESIQYTLTVYNCCNYSQWVTAVQIMEGWESLYATLEPEHFMLEPYGSRKVSVSVRVHDGMPAGSHEKTQVRFFPEGSSTDGQTISVYTLRKLEHPYIFHTADKWKEVAANIEREEIFHPGFEKLKLDADGWDVPLMVPFGERDYCYDTIQERYLMHCAYLYSITKNPAYAKKIAVFFRYFADMKTGYPARKKGCSQSYVQEGHFFQHLALAYDMIYDAGALTEEDHRGIENCFRIYMEILDRHIRNGHISNWVVSELTGAVYCAMALQDFERMVRFLFGPCGTFEQLSHGTFSDGWWHECSVGYHIWVSSMYLHTAHALLPFGINLINHYFPLSYGKEVDSIYKGETRDIRSGMYNEKWGGIRKGYICIKDLFDAVIPFLDERGVMFGINDSDEKKIEGMNFGSTFDLAYTHFRDPAYLPVIRLLDEVDPIFGHAHIPDCEAIAADKNAYADNIGLALLRSQAPGRAAGEQLQAVLRYGSHGFAHGHFDRTELLSVMRYGRSFYNPEHVWWGYPHFMYKFYVQNSNTKNMVVVDGKMQIPADSEKVLFYSGERLQAAAVRTVSRWGFPPFGGMIYDEKESLADRCRINACDLPVYDAAPHGDITEITEPVMQTRVMAVLDDCIVLFDSLRGEAMHRYESLMQIKGFQKLEPAGSGTVKMIGCTGKKSENPKSDEQFITDCHWYETEGETVARFVTLYGEGEDLRGTRSRYNTDGILCMDVYTAWPEKSIQSTGLAAEDHGQKAPYDLKVWEDAICVESFSANAWLLGARSLDIPLHPESRTLKLEIFSRPLYTEQNYPYASPQCLHLGGAHLELENGGKVSLSDLPILWKNMDSGFGIGKDYQGGRVLIEGIEYQDALPMSPVDHSQPGVMECPLDGLRAVRFKGMLGTDNFPGSEEQRRITYGVGQKAVNGRFITVIEPHDGNRRIVNVESLMESRVRIRYEDGSYQEVEAIDIDEKPQVCLETYRDGILCQMEHS